MVRYTALLVLLAAAAFAQAPRSLSNWWTNENLIAEGMNLGREQRTQMRGIIREYRPRLIEHRAAIERAEAELEEIFNQPAVDQRRGAEVIERLAGARAELTRELSQMSLRLRSILTTEQWQELRRRRAMLPVRPRKQSLETNPTN